MWNFIKINETGDHRYLFILPNYIQLPTQQPSPDIWQNITLELFETSNEDEQKIYISEYENILKQRAKYTSLSNALTVLRYEKDIELIAFVNKSGYTIKETSEYDYYSSIIKAEKHLQALFDKIKMITKQFDKKYNKETKTDYYAINIQLRKFGINFDLRIVSVKEFFAAHKIMIKENGKA
jgi:hypothetical protein